MKRGDRVIISATLNGFGYEMKGTVTHVEEFMKHTLVSVKYDKPDPFGIIGGTYYQNQLEEE